MFQQHSYQYLEKPKAKVSQVAKIEASYDLFSLDCKVVACKWFCYSWYIILSSDVGFATEIE